MSNVNSLRSIYDNMIARCHNPDCDGYEGYGARGVTVCQAWRDSFQQFLTDVGERPEGDFTLDRKDPSKGYSPENTRWATKLQQTLNTRPHRQAKSKYKGVYLVTYAKTPNKWRVTCQYKGVNKHVGYYPTEEDAARGYDAHLRARVDLRDLPFTYFNFPLEETTNV